MAWLYGALCILTWVALQMPRYNGPSNLIKARSADHFWDTIDMEEDDLVLGMDAAKKDKKKSKKAKT